MYHSLASNSWSSSTESQACTPLLVLHFFLFILLFLNHFLLFENVTHLYNVFWLYPYITTSSNITPLPPTLFLFQLHVLLLLLITLSCISAIHMHMSVLPSLGTWATFQQLHPQRKFDSLSLRSHQLRVLPWIGMGPWALSNSHWNFDWIDLVLLLCHSNHSCCESVDAKLCHIQKWAFHISLLCPLFFTFFPPHFVKFPVLWMVWSWYRWCMHSWALIIIYTWHLDQFWTYALTTIHCKKEASLPKIESSRNLWA